MRRVHLAIMGIVLAMHGAWAEAGTRLSVSSEGWTVSAEDKPEVLTISHERLGTVLQQVRLYLRGPHGLERLKGWSVGKVGENELSIRTAEPPTAWVIKPGHDALIFSTTTAEAVLTAEAPATSERIVARLVDPQGTPVTWRGTCEAELDYGAKAARNRSFLPTSNPEVMYFALGQVSGSNLHSLFDRKTDTVIDFPLQASMKRNPRDPNLLEITVPVPGNTLVRVVPDYFTKTLGLPYYAPLDDTYFRRAPMVWDSWESYYEKVSEDDIVRNADWIAAHLKPYGYEYVQLDDGYDRGPVIEHYWVERWDKEKFPHGPKWLTDYIKSRGLKAGIWLVPNAYAGGVEQHPEWYLRARTAQYSGAVKEHPEWYPGFKNDRTMILDYATPTLDPTNPEVLDFLKKEFTTLDDWGFEYYKLDGEHDFLKYVPGIDLDRIANRTTDPIVAYRNRLQLIREVVGTHRFIEGCPSGMPLDGIGYVNSYYTGEDVYNSWRGMYSLFSSINANAFLNHLAVYVMAGEMDVEPPMSVAEAVQRRPPPVVDTARQREEPMMGFGVTLPEARTVVTYVALSGVVYSTGSLMSELPQERLRLLKMTLPTMPILPIDLFSRGTDMPMWDMFKHTTPDRYIHNYPEILDVKVNAQSGVYDVVGLTNWRNGTVTKELAFADKLGLEADGRYIAFDYWAQMLAGVFKNQMKVEIVPHDTRVFLIHPLLDRPQLVGSSRHITGAYSIKELAWDGSQNRLRGVSETVPGDEYTLWFYIPKGFTVTQARASSQGKSGIQTTHQVAGNSLQLSFTGQQEVVDWEVKFDRNSGN